jgi:hypothetical protein
MNSFGEVATKAAVKSLTKLNNVFDEMSKEQIYVLGFVTGSGWAQFNQLTDEAKQQLIDSYRKAFGS